MENFVVVTQGRSVCLVSTEDTSIAIRGDLAPAPSPEGDCTIVGMVRRTGAVLAITACTHEGWETVRALACREGWQWQLGEAQLPTAEELFASLDNPALKVRRVDLDDCAELLKRHEAAVAASCGERVITSVDGGAVANSYKYRADAVRVVLDTLPTGETRWALVPAWAKKVAFGRAGRFSRDAESVYCGECPKCLEEKRQLKNAAARARRAAAKAQAQAQAGQ